MTAQFVPIFAKKDANGNYPDRPKINSHKPVKLDPDDPVCNLKIYCQIFKKRSLF
jgi:hypothetical protein